MAHVHDLDEQTGQVVECLDFHDQVHEAVLQFLEYLPEPDELEHEYDLDFSGHVVSFDQKLGHDGDQVDQEEVLEVVQGDGLVV